MEVISIHKKKSGMKDGYNAEGTRYNYNRPPQGKVRAQVIIKGKTRHVDVDG